MVTWLASGLAAVVLGLVVLTGISILLLSFPIPGGMRISHPWDLMFVSAIAIIGSVALGYYTRNK